MHNTKKCKPIFVIQTYEERNNSNSTATQNISDTLHQENGHGRCIRQSSLPASLPPPPPPPLPLDGFPTSLTNSNGNSVNTLKTKKTQKPRAPPVPEKRSTLSYHQPPPCPTPDYDTLSVSSSVPVLEQNGFTKTSHHDSVEMESLESFELHSPFGNNPKPPDIYFSNTSTPTNGSISSSTSTLRKQRPISITIGEYGHGTARKQPGKLDFLPNGVDETDKKINQPITSQFASELAQTLSRSNLRRRTESVPNSYK